MTPLTADYPDNLPSIRISPVKCGYVKTDVKSLVDFYFYFNSEVARWLCCLALPFFYTALAACYLTWLEAAPSKLLPFVCLISRPACACGFKPAMTSLAGFHGGAVVLPLQMLLLLLPVYASLPDWLAGPQLWHRRRIKALYPDISRGQVDSWTCFWVGGWRRQTEASGSGYCLFWICFFTSRDLHKANDHAKWLRGRASANDGDDLPQEWITTITRWNQIIENLTGRRIFLSVRWNVHSFLPEYTEMYKK